MKKLLIIVATLAVCGFSLIAQAQSGSSISGKLLDKDLEEQIGRAHV